MSTPPPTTRRLHIDLADLVDAFEDASREVSVFLDLESGEVLRVTADGRQELDAISVALPETSTDEAADRAALTAALERRGSPRWMHELVFEVLAVERGLGTRFVDVPAADPRDRYEDMASFVDTVAHGRLRERLWGAIRGRGAFQRFKDVLAGSPGERERWFAFRDARVRQRALAWLADEGIELVPEVG